MSNEYVASDVAQARTWLGGDELKAAMTKAGVIGSPNVASLRNLKTCRAQKARLFHPRTTLSGPLPFRTFKEENVMDKDRVAGSAKQVAGTVKEAVGKVLGDAKLESEGQADKAEGKVQNAIGGLKDVVRDAVKK
jgi:uncharacterized protein YjbJ (UPF0337 family)